MHREYRRAVALAAACWAGLRLEPGISDLHAWSAALNCGDLGSMPVPGPALSEIPPWLLGSGKALIPWARMHLE